mmetsp:Transcript_3795/g.8041  ORF Transcript_3795/g.8041 Transcript_3795/m.8041 type:complete len:90 (-) Transcript_3795:325-594(-)
MQVDNGIRASLWLVVGTQREDMKRSLVLGADFGEAPRCIVLGEASLAFESNIFRGTQHSKVQIREIPRQNKRSLRGPSRLFQEQQQPTK